MNGKRPIGETLLDIAAETLESAAAAGGVRVRRLQLALPVELVLRRTGEEVALLGELPQTLTRTAFDVQPGRLEILWEEEPRS